MKQFFKKIAIRLRQFAIAPFFEQRRTNPVEQQLLRLTYQRMQAAGEKLPALADTGFQCYSQTDEDGILLYIFALVGVTSRSCVELCAGDGMECNTANLIINHGWRGLLIDGHPSRVARAREFYGRHPATRILPPTIVEVWITRSNVNEVLHRSGFSGEVDLLSLDMDGVDYWILEAITAITPRVIVLEYHDILGPDRRVTVPYSDTFDGWIHTTDGAPDYCGASLAAYVKLGEQKGYRLVGVNRLGYNAFFIRHDLAPELPTVTPRECFRHPRVFQAMQERYPKVANLPWEEV